MEAALAATVDDSPPAGDQKIILAIVPALGFLRWRIRLKGITKR